MFQSAAITLALCFATITAQAALLGRAALTPGGTDYQAYYDTDLNITWLADANFAKTSGYDTDGLMQWANAVAFTNHLNAIHHLGITNWRLPATRPINGQSFNYDYAAANQYAGTSDLGFNVGAPGTPYAGSAASEMAHLHYITLGNLAPWGPPSGHFQAGWGLQNIGPFSNFPDVNGNSSALYWSSTPSTQFANHAFTFTFTNGRQYHSGTTSDFRAWAVFNGDTLAPVPVPAAVWLFGSALGLMGVIRRKAIA